MTTILTAVQQEVFNYIDEQPASAEEIADRMGYSSRSTVYDHIAGIRNAGIIVGQTDDGKYVPLNSVEVTGPEEDVQNLRSIVV